MAASQEKNKRKALLEGIAAEAEQETEKIAKEAGRQAEEIVRGAKSKAEDIVREGKTRGEQQAQAIHRTKQQEVEAERRKALLQAKEELYREAMEKIRGRMQELTDNPAYRDVVLGWVAEAALGLEARELVMNGGPRERELADGEFLREAAKETERAGGESVTIRLAEDKPLGEAGVLLSSQDGRVVFNNRLSARLERYGSKLRRMIYRHIEAEDAGTSEEGQKGNG